MPILVGGCNDFSNGGMMARVLITGGYGFIGSNLVRHWGKKHPEDKIIVLDYETYAARPAWALEVAHQYVHCDISDAKEVRRAIRISRPDHVIHLAAESHVCRSIDGPKDFAHTNIMGTFNLLESCRELWGANLKSHIFHHVSTDEVYGELEMDELEKFHEKRAYAPRSPYAASKAASDHIVNAWHHTYGMNTRITNCSNNFGPNQHAEKLIPKAIISAMTGKEMTVYGPGTQIRDWLYVGDHCAAIDTVFHEGKSGETYCVGGDCEMTNLEVINAVFTSVSLLQGHPVTSKVIHTDDRPTDDKRYAIDSTKLKSLGWRPSLDSMGSKIDSTVQWYVENDPCLKK